MGHMRRNLMPQMPLGQTDKGTSDGTSGKGETQSGCEKKKSSNNHVNVGINVGISMIIPDYHPGMSYPTSKRSFDDRKVAEASIRNLSATGHAGIRNFGGSPRATVVGSICQEGDILSRISSNGADSEW
jgi:hypothetical protein